MPNDLSSPTGVLDSPTTAVLHGMMTTLSEVLGGIDGRLAALERQLRETRAETGSPRALAQTVDAAVARLGERVEALETAVVSRPITDAALHAAVDALRQSVDALAVRPVRDDELHAAVAQLLARPAPEPPPPPPAPVFDEELRAAVARLTEIASQPPPAPVFDEELRDAVARLTEIASQPPPPPPPPVFDEELRDAVAQLMVRPTRDDELHAAVARLVELVSQPAPPTPADDPVRVGITSLHERLSVLLELAAQPPQPDDAVRTSLAELREDVAGPRDQSGLLELGERLRRLEERTAAADEDASTALRLALTRLGELAAAIEAIPDAIPQPPPVEIPPYPEIEIPPYPDIPDVAGLIAPLAADVAEMNRILTDHPAAKIVESMGKVEEQVASLVAQPGPGPAMAMVAAGLAERFESRTDALVESLTSTTARLDAVAAAPTDLAQRVEEFVGTQFTELARREDAVAAALGELRTAVAQQADDRTVADVLDRVRTVVEGQQGDVASMRDALRALFDAVERHGSVSGQVAELLLENRASLGREIDRLEGVVASHGEDMAERVRAALEAAARADAHAAEMGVAVSEQIDAAAGRLIGDVQAMVTSGQDPARLDAVAARISDSVRRESEMLTQRVAALSVAVDSLRATLDGLSDEMANSIGRKATEVGRRLAADLGIKKKQSGEKDRSLGPGSGS